MRGLAVEPWCQGEIYAVAADWAQASCEVLYWGDGDWVGTGRQVADYRHDDYRALAEFVRESARDGGVTLGRGDIDAIVSRATGVDGAVDD